MYKILKNTLDILNKNLWLIFVFAILLYIILIYLGMINGNTPYFWQFILAVITFIALVTISVAGYLGIVKEILLNPEDEIKKELGNIFPKSIAQYFLPVNGFVAIGFIVFVTAFLITNIIGVKLIGMFSFSSEALMGALNSADAINEFMKLFTPEDLVKVRMWHIFYSLLWVLGSYLCIYWLPVILFKISNPFWAFIEAIKSSFKKPLKTFLLVITIWTVNFIVYPLMVILANFWIMYPFAILVWLYAGTYLSLLTMNMYKVIFIDENISSYEQIEQCEKDEEE